MTPVQDLRLACIDLAIKCVGKGPAFIVPARIVEIAQDFEAYANAASEPQPPAAVQPPVPKRERAAREAA
jgi:hypothetical protein